MGNTFEKFDGFGGFDDDDGFDSGNSFNDDNFYNDDGFDDGFEDNGSDAWDSLDSGYSRSSSQSDDTDAEEFIVGNQSNNTTSKKEINKLGLIMIGIGILIIIVVFAGYRLITNKQSIKDSSTNKQIEIQQENTDAREEIREPVVQYVEQSPSTNTEYNNVTMDDVMVDRNTLSNNDGIGWVAFEYDESIEIYDDYVNSTFTVIEINHFARKAVDNGNNIELKSVVTGNISGFIGTYTLELPYSKGIRLDTGKSFNVQVVYGEYNGKTVVDEIIY